VSVATCIACPPALVHVPPGATGSYGDDVAEIAENVGRSWTPEQHEAGSALVAHDRRGRFLTLEAAIEGPRQTVGKSGAIMLPIVLWTALTDPDHITWTAHLAETALRQFQDLAGSEPGDEAALLVRCDWLRRRVRSVSWENGAEGVTFQNGSQLAFRVRSKMRGRGLSGNTVVNDEFLFATARQMGAQLPVLATRSLWGNARAYAASSAASVESDEQRRMRARALAGDPTLTFVGWWAAGGWDAPGCAGGSDCTHVVGSVGCALDDEALWASCNPLLGRLVSVEFLRSMRATLDPLEFGREFYGWQEAGRAGADAPVDLVAWAAGADRGSRRVSGGQVAMGIDVSRDRSSASVGWCGRRADGRLHMEVVRQGRGTGWVAGAVAELAGKIPLAVMLVKPRDVRPAIAGDALALQPLLPALTEAGVDPVLLGAGDIAAACGGLVADVADDRVRHLGQDQLDRAVRGAGRRDVGDGGMAFGKRVSSGADITPLYAVTAARWAFTRALEQYDLADGFA
jgi:hypothetical protein